MSSFEGRKDAFENKFVHDQALDFKMEARCCKLFGIWAAEQMGLSGPDAATYAKEVVAANLEEPGFDDIKRKVVPDFKAKGLDISDHVINTQLDKYMAEALKQIKAENS